MQARAHEWVTTPDAPSVKSSASKAEKKAGKQRWFRQFGEGGGGGGGGEVQLCRNIRVWFGCDSTSFKPTEMCESFPSSGHVHNLEDKLETTGESDFHSSQASPNRHGGLAGLF